MSNFLGSVQPTGGLEIFSLKGYRISLLRTFSTPSKQSFLSRTDCMKTGAKFTPRLKRTTTYWQCLLLIYRTSNH